MESKKINQLATEMSPATSDLTIIGDPTTGVSKKVTLLQIADLFQTTGTVTSVAVTETGDALTITGSPITSAGTINIGFSGDATEYVRGDGTLADFPTSTGGGSSVSYYLNTSVSQGTIGGVAYKQLSKVPISGAGTDVSTSVDGYIASYITDANDPALLEVPAGNFNCEFYFSVNSNAHNPYVYAEIYKYDGTTFTLLGSSQSVPEYLTNGTTLSPYYFAIPVSTSVLTITDRISIRIYVNVDGRTVTLHTENNHLCQVVTTFSKGLISLNNLTRQNQFFATGTSGTDFAISSATATHTFNLPVASASNTGKLSSTDWTTFNAKQNTITLTTTGTSGASTLVGATLNIPNYGSALTGYVPYTGATQAVNLGAFDLTVNGVKIGIGAGSLTSNTILGAGSLGLNTTGYENTAVGNGAMYSNTTGYDNVAVGYGSLTLNTSGTYNTAIGSRSLFTNTTGNNNTAIGNLSLNLNTTGSQNSALGAGTLTANTTGSNNVGIGNVALQQNTTGDNNTAIGSFSSYVNTTGANNTSVGASSLSANTTGQYNTAIGSASLNANTTAFYNTAIGYASLNLNTTGQSNVAVGGSALGVNTTGQYNVGVGRSASNANTTGNYNTALGGQALANVTTGSQNIAIGYNAGGGITTGSQNTIIGTVTGLSSSLANNIILADGAGNVKYQWDGTSNNFDGILKSSGALWVNTSAGSPNSMIILAQVAGTQPPTLGNSSIGVNTTDFRFTATTTSTNFKSFSFSTSSLTNNSVRTYSMPDADGIIALTSNITSAISGTTNYHAKFTGTNTIGNSLIWDNGTNVGIGNTNTSYTLDVSGTGRFTGALSGTSATFSGGITATGVSLNPSLKLINTTATTGVDWNLYSLNNGNFGIYNNTAGAYALQILPSGNVGIGTASPSTKVHIYEPLTNASAYLTVQNNRARNSAVYTQTTNGGFYAGTSIGTDTFNYQIYDAVAGAARLTIASTGAATFSSSVGIAVTPITDPYTATGGGWKTVQFGKGGILGAYGTDNESMSGFNTYVTTDGSNKAIISSIGGTAIRYYEDRITFNTLSTSGTAQTQTERMRITSGGVVQIAGLTSNGTVSTQSSNGSLYVSSDANLKIEDGFVENGLEKVLALKPRYFYWKDKESFSADRQLGFYAQEVNAVSEETANTPPEGCGWGIYDRGLVALLTSAIQEMNTKLDEQNQTIQNLQEQINILAK